MEFEEFDALVEAARSRYAGAAPPDIKLFDSWLASDEDLLRAERALKSRLPMRYKDFMRRYGGGQFLFLDVLPVISPDGKVDDLLSVSYAQTSKQDFVAVAPVGTGDWWGFTCRDGVCDDQVSFLDHEDGSFYTEATDFLEFAVARGLRYGR